MGPKTRIRQKMQRIASHRSPPASASGPRPPPRAKTKHRRKGWIASTIRGMLLNEARVGVWTFKKRHWKKVPGTNERASGVRVSARRADGDHARHVGGLLQVRRLQEAAHLLEFAGIVLTPVAEGHYVAEGRFVPLVALVDPALDSAPVWGRRASRYIGDGCAGAIRPMYHELSAAFRVRIAA